MRIIGGNLKGRRISPPKGLPIRPTTDRTKESLFNILNNRLDFSSLEVIDLFAGSGGIGLEFLSRNAKNVVFVDSSFRCCSFINQTIEGLKLINRGFVVKEKAERFIDRNKKEVDLIFADPPYNYSSLEGLAEKCLNSKSLKDNGRLILEHHNKINFRHLKYFEEDRTYGQSIISIFRKTQEQ